MTDAWITPQPTAQRASGKARAEINRAAADLEILHLAELVPMVRERFALADSFADDAILASLRVITNHSQPRERWRAAFSSNLGIALVHEGCDLNTTLNTLLALLPRPRS
ncbi:MAG: hypothetical protein ABL904_22620 [Hyphomicrobiaceae bacterium]